MRPIYLDYNATTPVAPEAVDAMLPYLTEHFGNPSSTHALGRAARAAVERARHAVGALLNADPGTIVFTSGGTEGNNLAIEGVVRAGAGDRRHLITTVIEHPSVMEVFDGLARQGFRVSKLPVNEYGMVRPEDLEREVGRETLLVSVMHANNEVGTIQPVAELARIAHRAGALMHTDAAQSIGKIPVDVAALEVDLLTLAGHKMYAPKGVGALFVGPAARLGPVIRGASHERGLRPGTEAVAQIVALAEAARLAARRETTENVELGALRDRLEEGLRRGLGDGSVRSNGDPQRRLPNTLSVSCRGLRGDALLRDLGEQVAASAGSACHAREVRLSPVLAAMGVAPEWGMGTLRLSVGRYTTAAEVDAALAIIVAGIRRALEQRSG